MPVFSTPRYPQANLMELAHFRSNSSLALTLYYDAAIVALRARDTLFPKNAIRLRGLEPAGTSLLPAPHPSPGTTRTR